MPTQFRITRVFKVVHLGRMWVVHLRANIDTRHWGPVGSLYEDGTATPVVGDAAALFSRLAHLKTPAPVSRAARNAGLLDDIAPADSALVLGTLLIETGEMGLACQMFHLAEDIASDCDDPSRKSAALAGEALCWLESELASGHGEYGAARHFANWSHAESCKVDMFDQRERDFLWISRAAIVRAIADCPEDPRRGLLYIDELRFDPRISSWGWYEIVESERRIVRALLLESVGKMQEAVAECQRSIEFAVVKGLAASELRMRQTLLRILETSNGDREQAEAERCRVRELRELCGIDSERTLFGVLSNKPLQRPGSARH
jgi:hypothetical protein